MTSPSRSLLVLETIAVGLAFCAFKAIVGWWLVGTRVAPLGWVLIALAGLDALLNAVNLIAVAATGKRRVVTCTLEWLVGRFAAPARAEAIGTAIDTLLAFALVAIAVGGGLISSFSPKALWAWNIAVVVNVLGAGFSRLAGALSER